MKERFNSVLCIAKKTFMPINFLKFGLFLLLSALAVPSYAVPSDAGAPAAPAGKISLTANNTSLRQLFKSIEKQSGYVFLVSDASDAELDKRVTLEIKEAELPEALKRLLAGTDLAYLITEGQITVYNKTARVSEASKETEGGGNLLSVRGVVVDTKEPPTPLVGATIIVKGTPTGTTTDGSGFFSLKAKKGDMLVVSYLGYQTKEVRVNASVSNMSIALAEDATALEQVVVTGMTSQAKVKVASSVGIIENTNFTNKPITRLSQALQGGTTGVFVSQSSGMPGGDGAKIKIRGVASLLGSDPLVLIDGFESDMDKLDPSTVESISVLKDASAASMYGAKAGNGVIVITTKRGTAGRVQVGYNGYFGVQQPLYRPDFGDAVDYMNYYNAASVNSGASPSYTDIMIETTRNGSDPINFPNTDWTKETMREFTNIQEHNLSVSGGNTTARFALAAQYMSQDGIYKYMDNGFERLSVRLNTTINLSKTLFTYVDAFVNRDVQRQPNTTNTSLIDFIYRTPPTVAGIYPRKEGQREDMVYYGIYQTVQNPLYNLQKGIKREEFKDYVTLNIRPTWYIIPELVLKGQVGYRLSSGLTRRTRPAFQLIDYFTDDIVFDSGKMSETSYPNRQSYWTANLMLDWNKDFKNGHTLNLIGGWSSEYDMRNAWDVVTLVSFFGKAYYSYDNRYMLEISARGDGSSLFDKGHKWGFFPSAAVGWNIANESFLKDAKWLNTMKLRLSYGKLGNNHVNPYKYQSLVSSSGNETVNGNPNLTWEVVSIWNAGLDLSFFDNQLDLTVDVFRKKTTDLIVNTPSTLSSALLNSFQNAGDAKVDGFEISAGYNHNFNKHTRIGFNAGYSYTKSKLTRVINSKIVSGDRIYQQGRAITEYYGYVADGLLTQRDIDDNYPIIGGYNSASLSQQPGDVKYVDMNGDGIINDSDRMPIGRVDPESVYYMNLSFSWKNLDFEAQANGVGSVPVFYTNLISNPLDGDNGGKPQRWHFDYWTEDHQTARFPRPTLQAGNNGLFSTFWRENGAFLRVRYIQLGYSCPWLAKKIRAESIRIYANVQNPFTFTNVELIDPESKGTYSTYPMFRTYSVGLNVRF